MTEAHAVITVFGGYLLVLVAIAFWSRRESQSVEGFFIAGKRLPFWVVAFSFNATGESGWLILGLTGMGYAVGIHALWVVLGELVGIALSWLLVARRFKHATDSAKSITVPDYLEARFSDGTHLLRWISALVILVMTCTYVGAQLVATGKAFSEFTSMSYAWSVVVGALIIVLYTAVGGFKAVSYTDVVQGVLMVAGLIVLPATAVVAAGGWSEVTSGLAEADPALLSLLGRHGWSMPAFVAVVSFLAIGLPFFGVPQLLVRFMSIRSERELRTAACISVGTLAVMLGCAVLTGMAGRVLFPDLSDPELIMPVLSRELFPPLITAILAVVLLAAVMSTVDSLFILASSAVTRDLVQRIFLPGLTDRTVANLGSAVTLAVGVAGLLIALTESRTVFWFALFSWSGLGATFGPVILCSLYWKGTTRAGAVAGMLGGFLTAVLWVGFLKDSAYGLYEMVPGFIVSMLLTVSVSLMEAEWRRTKHTIAR